MLVSVHSLPNEEQVSDARPLAIGDFEIDLGARLLTRRGEHLRLSPKAFTLLEALVRARPRALSKAELQELIWPGTFVVEANLANLVSEVRRALDDDPAQPRLLRTVYGYGYAWRGQFAAPSPPQPDPAASYWLFLGRTPFVLPAGEYILGRGQESIVPLHSEFVSRRHAQLVLGRHAVLTDLGSRNGTFVCGRRIVQPVTLRHLDEIRIGPYYLTLALPVPEAPTTRPGHEFAPIPTDM